MSGNIISIKAKNYRPPAQNSNIESDDELLKRVLELYGIPIRTINGVPPDANGNLSIIPDPETSLADGEEPDDGEPANARDSRINKFKVMIAGINSIAGALRITLDQRITCDTTEVIEVLMENIAELNRRASIIADTLDKLDAANSVLASKLDNLV